jgi:hypothetical protein
MRGLGLSLVGAGACTGTQRRRKLEASRVPRAGLPACFNVAGGCCSAVFVATRGPQGHCTHARTSNDQCRAAACRRKKTAIYGAGVAAHVALQVSVHPAARKMGLTF